MKDEGAMIAPGGGTRGPRWWTRRLVIVAVVVSQLIAILFAYGRPHQVFGWQMFNASSDWQAEIVRVETDGSRHDVRESWPGGYEWSLLVSSRGLDAPFFRQHAHSGLRTTFDIFEAALDWVATNTPRDTQTLRLEAVVTSWHNGRDPELRLFVSVERPEARP